jgi:hypothetical protein
MKRVRRELNCCQFLIRDFYLGWIYAGIAFRVDVESLTGGCPAYQFDDNLVTGQGLSTPIHADIRKQAMFDFVPFAGSCHDRGKNPQNNRDKNPQDKRSKVGYFSLIFEEPSDGAAVRSLSLRR